MPLPDYSLPKSFYWDFTDVYGCLKNFAKNVECERGKRKVSDMKVKFEKRVWSEFQVVLTITIVVKRVFWRYLRNCDCEQMWQVQSRCGGKIGCKYGKWVGIDCPKTRKISKVYALCTATWDVCCAALWYYYTSVGQWSWHSLRY